MEWNNPAAKTREHTYRHTHILGNGGFSKELYWVTNDTQLTECIEYMARLKLVLSIYMRYQFAFASIYNTLFLFEFRLSHHRITSSSAHTHVDQTAARLSMLSVVLTVLRETRQIITVAYEMHSNRFYDLCALFYCFVEYEYLLPVQNKQHQPILQLSRRCVNFNIHCDENFSMRLKCVFDASLFKLKAKIIMKNYTAWLLRLQKIWRKRVNRKQMNVTEQRKWSFRLMLRDSYWVLVVFNENEKLPKRINFVWATFSVK